MKLSNQHGFLLTEVVIAVAVVTILGSALVPSLSQKWESRKIEKTATEVYHIQAAARNYRIQTGNWPADIATLKGAGYLPADWTANNIWGNPYAVQINGGGESFSVKSQMPAIYENALTIYLPAVTVDPVAHISTSTIPKPGAEATSGAFVLVDGSRSMTGDLTIEKDTPALRLLDTVSTFLYRLTNSGGDIKFINNDGNTKLILDQTGNLLASGDVSGGKFIDGSDGNYYVDPAGDSVINNLGAAAVRVGAVINTQNTAAFQVNDGSVGFMGAVGAKPTPDFTGTTYTGLFWYPAKKALYAGVNTGTEWDDANIGTGSLSFGTGVTASGAYALAAGQTTTASGAYSRAEGHSVSATGAYGHAIGKWLQSTANYAFVYGRGTSDVTPLTNSLANSFMLGWGSTQMHVGSFVGVNGGARITIGKALPATPNVVFDVAQGIQAAGGSALGSQWTHSLNATANGDNLIGMQIFPSFNDNGYAGVNHVGLRVYGLIESMADGIKFPDGTTQTSAATASPWTRSGTTVSYVNAGDTMSIGSGATGNSIVSSEGNVLAKGTHSGVLTAASLAGYTGAGSRLIWLPEISAFRAGAVTGVQWDAASIAPYSFATSYNNIAAGIHSAVIGGSDNSALGEKAFIVGSGNTIDANGINSMILGGSSNAITSTGSTLTNSFILGGSSNSITDPSMAQTNNAIINGNNNAISGNSTQATIIGTNNTVSASSRVYMLGGYNSISGGGENYFLGRYLTTSAKNNTVNIGIGHWSGTANTLSDSIMLANGGISMHVSGTGTSTRVAIGQAISSATGPTGFNVIGNMTAQSGAAHGSKWVNTLTAAANNDDLVGMLINPTFVNGAYTGVTNTAIRGTGIIHSTSGGFKFPDGTVQTTAAVASTNYWSRSGTTVSLATANDTVAIGAASGSNALTLSGGNILAKGTAGAFTAAALTGYTGAGTKFFWLPQLGAFRAGGVNGTQWDGANLGSYSFSSGYNNYASGAYSFSGGTTNQSTGESSTTLGQNNIASNYYTVAMGVSNTASSFGSIAIGSSNTATTGNYNGVYGGMNNTVNGGGYGYIFGGTNNTNSTSYADILGGTYNLIGASGSNALTLGNYLNPNGAGVVMIGNGLNSASRLTGTLANSVIIGGGGTIPAMHLASSGTATKVAIGAALGSTTGNTAFVVQQNATAGAGVAYGSKWENTLSAAANNDTLVGMYIKPTFVNGALTGVTNLAVRADGIIHSTTGGFKFPDGTIQTTAAGAGGTNYWSRSGTTVSLATANDTVALGSTSGSNALTVNGGNILVKGTYTGSLTAAALTGYTGAGERLMWIPEKVAFRVGSVSSTEWDTVGNYSIAIGNNGTATGASSINIGSGNTTSTSYAMAFGYNSSSAQYGGMVIGRSNSIGAGGNYSYIMGGYNNSATNATGYSSIHGGTNNSNVASYADIMGGTYNLISASGTNAITLGNYLNPNAAGVIMIGNGTSSAARMYCGLPESIVLVGKGTVPAMHIGGTGTGSRIAIGSLMASITGNTAFDVTQNVTASSAAAYGSKWTHTLTAAANNDDLVGMYINPTFANGAFTGVTNTAIRGAGIIHSTTGGFKFPDGTIQTTAAGGGSNYWSRSGTTVSLATANDTVAIGTTTGSNALTVSNGNILAKGTLTLSLTAGALTGYTGAGSRLMWLPENAAFRAGGVEGTQWDTIGNYSFATGRNNTASNSHTVALGYGNTVSGLTSVGIGLGNTVSTHYSNIIGAEHSSTVGDYATALGNYLNPSNTGAVVIGNGLNSLNRLTNSLASSVMLGGGGATPSMHIAGYGTGTKVAIGKALTGTTGNTGFDAVQNVTASSGAAYGSKWTHTLTAAADNDALVGMHINPTFANGAFAGVTNTALKVSGNVEVVGDGTYTGSWTQSSDLRFKKDINPIPNALNTVLALRGVNYRWRCNEFPQMAFNNRLQVGFVAQEIEQHLPEVVSTNAKGYKSVAYQNVVPVLVEALKELNTKIVKLQQLDGQRTARDDGSVKHELIDHESLKKLVTIDTAKIPDQDVQGYVSARDVYLADKKRWASETGPTFIDTLPVYTGPARGNFTVCNVAQVVPEGAVAVILEVETSDEGSLSVRQHPAMQPRRILKGKQVMAQAIVPLSEQRTFEYRPEGSGDVQVRLAGYYR